MQGTTISISIALALAACGPDPRDHGNGGGDGGSGSGDGGQNGDCAEAAEFVYTIDQFTNQLSRFDPATKTFMDLGALSCPTSGGATPFSMSVDRNTVAWVLYNSGELFRVDILNALACTKTTWNSPNNLKVFGMGFSTDQAGGSTEALYIGGGRDQMQTSYTLARVDTTTMTATPIGMQPALPEMTGTGNAELWGFFPDASMPRVVQFDKSLGTVIQTYPQPTLAGTMTGYAFAHWGGDFWVFLLKNGEPATTVYQVSGATGAIVGTTPTSGRTIVGAGVSTCAPTVIF
ncbi:MAG TPA: hypothetical protein VFQ53_33510 [Kofleriaceae bacterium]|nr:hypothetical protein [Kofleriaceae bacterium]